MSTPNSITEMSFDELLRLFFDTERQTKETIGRLQKEIGRISAGQTSLTQEIWPEIEKRSREGQEIEDLAIRYAWEELRRSRSYRNPSEYGGEF